MPAAAESGLQRFEPVLRDVLVGNDDRVTAAHQRQDLGARAFNQPRPDDDVISAVAQRHPEPFTTRFRVAGFGVAGFRLARIRLNAHSWYSKAGGIRARGQSLSAAIARVTVASGDPSPLSTVKSASA